MSFVFEGYAPKSSNSNEGKEGQFVFEGYQKPKNEIGRSLMQGAIGAGKGAIYASPAAVPAIAGEFALPGATQNVISELLESDIMDQYLYPGEFPPLNRGQIEQGAKEAEEQILGKEGLVGGAVSSPFRAAGIETEPKTSEEKATRGVGEFLALLRGGGASPMSLKKAASGAFIGEAGKEALVELGTPEWLAEIISLGSAAHIANMAPKVGPKKTSNQKLNESVSERSKFKPGTPPPEPPPRVTEKFESGLTKPRAVEASRPELGLISKGDKRKVVEKLEKEAQDLFKESIGKHVPLTKKIEEGFDFAKYHEEGFGKLKAAAEKFNPKIDTTPINKFFSETAKQYRGTKPKGDAKAIISEMQYYSRRPPSDLSTLLKIRRSNSKELKSIYEKRLLNGTRDQYVDFLNKMNRTIDEAVQKTLPEDSSWFREFKKMNKEFRDYMSAKKTLDLLEPIFREKVNSSAVTKIATNPNTQKKLEISLGKEGASELVQISKDLKKATEAIKRMTTESYKHFNSIFSLSFFMKPVKWARKGYGHVLSSPSRRQAFDESLKAISNNDVEAYAKAVEKIKSP